MFHMFDQPWRKQSWGDKEEDLQHVREYKPANNDVNHLRILLYGPVGSGKSSFINSVSNVIRGRMSIPALGSVTTSDSNFTNRYETHKFKKGRGSQKTFYPLVFNDIMGLEDGTKTGVHAEDIKLAMKGHVREGHKFNPVCPLKEGDPGYNPEPRADDKVHVLLHVISADTYEFQESVLRKMRNVRETARDLGIPQLVIMTNIDGECVEIGTHLRNVYKSRFLKGRMEEFSSKLAIPMNCIFPVKNYREETEMDDDVDILILKALRHIINFGDDFIEDM